MHVQADLDADRQVAATLAELIIGGTLASAIAGHALPRPRMPWCPVD